PISETEADTAVFYSISNTQNGLRGVSFGNLLIKQVVEELLRDLPGLKTFVTLSPVPGFAAWLATQQDAGDERIPPQLFALMNQPEWHLQPEARTAIQPSLEQAAAIYLIEAKAPNGKPADPVARFHLNNGAALERINFCGDPSAKGMRQSHGIMVNYLYDLDAIDRNHEAYANAGEVTAAGAVRRKLRK
ncbi:MAG: malonyl-CoA decarboxylase family protein, partial [Alphaproteobacteria bacterium]|nr:malonyl-CoA decarboxylase family protein [Alphaproteobacteria bacterium]